MPTVDTKVFEGLVKARTLLDWMDQDRKMLLFRLIHQTLEPHITGPWQSWPIPLNHTVHLYVAVCDRFYVEFELGMSRTKACIRVADNNGPAWFEASLDTDDYTDFVGWLSVARNVLDEWVDSRTKPVQVLPEMWWAQTERKKGWV